MTKLRFATVAILWFILCGTVGSMAGQRANAAVSSLATCEGCTTLYNDCVASGQSQRTCLVQYQKCTMGCS
jgi:hypothetical protein